MRKRLLTIAGIVTSALFFAFPAHAQEQSFFVQSDYDISGRSRIAAVLEYQGARTYFFVDQEYLASLSDSERERLSETVLGLSSEFDTNIYPKLTEAFGLERNPGIDQDPKITVLLHPMKIGVGGYFRESDEYARGVFADSNAREMVYVDADKIVNSPLGPAFLAHEFQHLITFNQKTFERGAAEEKWLNEAFSEYAPTLAGYDDAWLTSYARGRVEEFLSHPSDALIDWRGRSIDHASVNMFIHYLADRYGINLLKEMMKSDTTGIASINEALQVLEFDERFQEVFGDWVVTLYVNSPTISSDSKFQYKSPNFSFANLHVLPATTLRIYDNNSGGANFLIDNWSGQWHRFIPGALGEESALHIRIVTGDAAHVSVPYILGDFFGGTEVRFFDPSKGQVLTIPDFGNFISSVVVAPTLTIPGQENYSAVGSFSLEAFASNSSVTRFQDGALVRSALDTKVYVVKNGSRIGQVFKRWIPTEEVFGFYKHFNWNDVISVKEEFATGFQESFLIRRAGDYKVYEVGENGSKRWLNMTPAQFEARGYKWDAVYDVNAAEFEWYK